MDRPDLAIIIPALNEESSIGAVVSAAKQHGATIVVSDGSTDKTADVAERAGAFVLCHQSSRGYDEALNSGFRLAANRGAKYAITIDGDGQHDPQLIPRFVGLLEQGGVMVVGIRPRPARLAERLFAIYVRRRYGVRDPLCGMKGYRMSVYSEVGHFDHYRSLGTELLLHCLRRRYPIAQVRVEIAPRHGRSRMGAAARANLLIAKALIRGVLGQNDH